MYTEYNLAKESKEKTGGLPTTSLQSNKDQNTDILNVWLVPSVKHLTFSNDLHQKC